MALPGGFLDELKARVPLASVIGRRVRLIRNGRHFKACCPFHNEKTPSFHVYDDHYHCYGCGAHGDAISFEMAAAGLTFMEAVEAMAAEAGLEVPRPDPKQREREARATSLQDVVEAACAFFEQKLRLPEGQEAAGYLARRGLSAATIARFRLGYAPPGGALRGHLKRGGIDEDTLVEAGLAGRPEQSERAPYDMFRDRVIFPIRDRKGRVVSFGGRVLGDGKPKYLNGPDSPLFNKSGLLYGLFEAREAIRESGEAIVTEGYMDVIALSAAGFPQTVAPLGTALTETQIEILWTLAAEPILCFDGDEAGQRAARRALDRALPMLVPGRSLRFALLPPGQDPDDLLRERGPGAIRAVLDTALPMAEMCWRSLRARHRLDTPERRAALERDIDRTVQDIDDRSVAQQYRAALRDRFWAEVRAARGLPGRGVRSGARAPARASGGAPLGAVPGPAGELPVRRLQESVLLATVLNHLDLFEKVAERLGMLPLGAPDLADLRADLLVACDTRLHDGQVLDRDDILNHLREAGHGATLDHVLGQAVGLHAAFARPSASVEAALSGWDHAAAQHSRSAVLDDCRAAEERWAEDMTEEALARLTALQSVRMRLFDLPEGEAT
jgi:DNA primase